MFAGGPAPAPALPTPATLPRPKLRHSSRTLHRSQKPKPLELAASHFRVRPDAGGSGGGEDGRAPDPQSTLLPGPRKQVSGAARPLSVTPAGSDRDYDGGDSSYSTSPLGSETNTKIRGRLRTVPFSPRMPQYTGHGVTSAADNAASAGLLSPKPRYRRAADPRESSLDKFLQDHIHTIETRYTEKPAAGDAAANAGSPLPSSDELYTSTDTNPVHSRHRHRVAGTTPGEDDALAGGVGLCNCGMQQCCQCGLFISRPETHACIGHGELGGSLSH